MQIHTKVKGINKLNVKAKIQEDKDKDGNITDSYIVTTVSFECQNAPGEFDNVLRALTVEQPVNVAFASPQAGLDEAEVTISSGGLEVTMSGEELADVAALG